MVLRLGWPGSMVSNWHDTRLGEETMGEIARNLSQGDSVMIGPFAQWHKLQFWVTDSLKLPSMERIKKYPLSRSDEIVDEFLGFLYFQLPKVQPADTIFTDMNWSMKLKKDENLEAMPPPEILAYYGNPFVPSEEIKIPADGKVYMSVDRANQSVVDDLYMDVPTNQLFLPNLKNHVHDTLNLGRMSAGETIRFFIRSSNTIVGGQNLYPETYDEAFLRDRGYIFFKWLHFEDWTDMLFDDVLCSFYLVPDNYGDFPWSIQVQFSPAVLAPGDTADIILHKRNEDGSLEIFPDYIFFDVQILDNSEYGTIYCPVWEETSDSLFSIPQVFQFIAKANIDTDSVVVRISVNVSGVIAGVSVNDNPVIGIERVLPDSLVNAQKKSHKPGFLSLSESQAGVEASGNAPPTGPVFEDVTAEDFSFGVGQVLITQVEDSLDHFTVMFEPDTIGLSDSSVMTIIAKNKEDEEILLSDSILLKLTIDSLQKGFGEFISNSKDALLLPFDSLFYGDARRGRIKYHSNDALNLDDQPYLINPVISRKGNSAKNGTGQLVIHQADTILVTVVQDTIAHGDSAIIKIQAQDKNGLDVHLPYSTLISLTLDTAGVKYGSFYDTDILTATGFKSLDSLPYGKVRAGGIIYVADGVNPVNCNPRKTFINAAMVEKPEINGQDSLIVKCHFDPIVQYYSQCNPAWKDSVYDHSSSSVCGIGCALSCMAMAMTTFGDNITPGQLNHWMKYVYNDTLRRKRLSGEGGYSDNGWVNWSAIVTHSQENIDINYQFNNRLNNKEYATNLKVLDSLLNKCNLIIVQVFNEQTGNQHWVLVTGKDSSGNYTINDPGRGEEFLSAYGNSKNYFWKYVVVSKKIKGE